MSEITSVEQAEAIIHSATGFSPSDNPSALKHAEELGTLLIEAVEFLRGSS